MNKSEPAACIISVQSCARKKKLLAGLQTENCKFNEAQARSAVTYNSHSSTRKLIYCFAPTLLFFVQIKYKYVATNSCL